LVGARVFKPPESGARAICEWAIDLWPYVNGKALTNGIRLEELEISDMLDVLHYYMEEDYNFSNSDQVEAKSRIRKTIYKTMYNKEYKFGAETEKDYSLPQDFTIQEEGSTPSQEEDPLKGPTKSYVPPTNFNPDSVKPFGNLLDAPFEL
jgi:hypothetical protein